MKTNSPKKGPTFKTQAAPVKSQPFTLQKAFDKWFLPFLFVIIGGVIGWAIWKH